MLSRMRQWLRTLLLLLVLRRIGLRLLEALTHFFIHLGKLFARHLFRDLRPAQFQQRAQLGGALLPRKEVLVVGVEAVEELVGLARRTFGPFLLGFRPLPDIG